ncbi:hypothetical protein GCM10010472_18010 [Pseudonocardia halophobica]|uniref:Uncharacterized protein n=1 Tax=Pseudonocardia halophobica TaxID=29401 RepID=A0A9W6L2Q3_9PSEU|nr:hypothetical protein [Pseudonocardia halophobica]GLL09984.1 hypothetical protein GCM10017577_11240 [Pseudonocardia halophobica]
MPETITAPTRSTAAEAAELLDETLAGAEANDRADLIRRVRRARETLRSARNTEHEAAAIRAAGEETDRALASLGADLRYRRASLTDPTRANRLRAELARTRTRSDHERALAREWPQLLADGFATLVSDAEFAVRTASRSVLAEAEAALAATDPRKDRARLDEQLRTRLVVEADRTREQARDTVAALAARLDRHLELDTPLEVPALPMVTPASLVENLAPPTATHDGGRMPVPARMARIVMPSYAGIMMSLVLTRVFHVTMPLWILITGAVVAALALGGSAVAAERKRSLDRRRQEARTRNRAVVDEFQIVLVKQLRDASRTAQTTLRRAAGTAVTARERETTAQLEEVRRTVEELRDTSRAIKAVDADLTSVADLRARARRLAEGT